MEFKILYFAVGILLGLIVGIKYKQKFITVEEKIEAIPETLKNKAVQEMQKIAIP